MKTETLCREVPCDRGVAERPRYYARQLITSDDLTLEQEYFRNKLRAHNRLLHGWGVVCGAHVCPRPSSSPTNGSRPWEVVVEPGYILGPYGDEMIIDCERVVDLRTSGFTGASGEPDTESIDPWCSQVYVPRCLTGPLYVAVKYKESQTRLVRVQPAGCSCDDNQCEYSRFRDCYEIGVLDYCPEGDVAEPAQTNWQSYLQSIGLMSGGPGLSQRCLPCPPEPWVVLARVTLDDDGVITEIDNCECRRIVISFGPYALRCHTDMPTVTGVEPQNAPPDTEQELKITGTNFKAGMRVSLGAGIAVDNTNATWNAAKTEYTVKIKIDEHAAPGDRRITLINPGCATATSGTFKVDQPVVTNVAMAPNPSTSTRRRSRASKGKIP